MFYGRARKKISANLLLQFRFFSATVVIASEAKQSVMIDCFVAALLAMTTSLRKTEVVVIGLQDYAFRSVVIDATSTHSNIAENRSSFRGKSIKSKSETFFWNIFITRRV